MLFGAFEGSLNKCINILNVKNILMFIIKEASFFLNSVTLRACLVSSIFHLKKKKTLQTLFFF